MKRPINDLTTVISAALIVIFVIAILILMFYFYAWLIIWALNLIFSLGIDFNFFTGFAVLFLTGIIKVKFK